MIFRIFFIFIAIFSASLASQTQKTVRISLGYSIDPCQAPVFCAQKLGLFEKQGIKVEIMNASGGEEASRMVASKGADIGITKLPNHIVRVAKGMPLKRIATLVGTSLERLIVRPDLGDLKNLKGKKIAFYTSNPDFSLLVLDKILEKNGLSRADINLITLQQGLAQAFITKQVDAIFTATDPHDTKLLEEKKISFKAYSYKDFRIPDFDQFMLFVHADNETDTFIPKIIAALTQSIAFIQNNPHVAWQDICEKYPELNTDLNREIWRDLAPKFQKNPGDLDLTLYTNLLVFMNTPYQGESLLLKTKVGESDIVAKNRT